MYFVDKREHKKIKKHCIELKFEIQVVHRYRNDMRQLKKYVKIKKIIGKVSP